MKLHLPVSLFRSLVGCMTLLACPAWVPLCHAARVLPPEGGALTISYGGEYHESSDSVLYQGCYASTREVELGLKPIYGAGGAVCNYGSYHVSDRAGVSYERNRADEFGGAIANSEGGMVDLSNNSGSVIFSNNCSDGQNVSGDGGAIYNGAGFNLHGNNSVGFSCNGAFGSGGAIYNSGMFSLDGNGNIAFNGNRAACSSSLSSSSGILIGNHGSFISAGSDDGSSVASSGGAIYNSGTFSLLGNGNVTFSGNTVTQGDGGAIGNAAGGTLSLSGNGDVLFEKNAEVCNGTYRLRSIYSTGELYLSATEGKSITFRDSVYASGRVVLNPDGQGDIIFSGASTKADLRVVKGGVNGTAEEILLSRTSEFATPVQLDAGRLVVEDGAILRGRGIELDADVGATATLRLKDGSLEQNGYALTFNSSTTLEVEGVNSISAASVDMRAGSMLSFIVGAENLKASALTMSGSLNTETISISITASQSLGELGEGYALLSVSDYDTSAWTSDKITIVTDGVSFEDFIWQNGTLYFKSAAELPTPPQERSAEYDSISIWCGDTFELRDYQSVSFSANSWSSDCAVYNHWGAFILAGNGNVSFNGYEAGVIDNENAQGALEGNNSVIFSGNAALRSGGAILNIYDASFSLNGNENVTFSGNKTLRNGGAISNEGGSLLELEQNGDVTFIGNSASLKGGAIFNEGTFTLSGNGDVRFEKNAEVANGTYRLRSIYSERGALNLSATEGKSILFKDSVYAAGTVNLNQNGTGDIIFTGASTEADLHEVKGGIEGTAQEILNSRTSEIATNASLYGGRLVVEDCAILKGRGITVTEGADATIRLNGGTLDETGYAVAVSSGSGLEFEGENTLAAASVSLAGGSFLSFILDEAQTAVNWNANLDIQGGLTLNLTHDDKPVHDTYALLAMQSGNSVTGWDAAALTISGTTAEHLVWEGNTLYYRPMLVQENGDTTLDKDVDTDAAGGTIGGKDDVSIDGNGHTLTVKNEVQLVQMALKDGIVRLDGENNNIVSVSLTEGGELVLTAGAGLKTGDIISMVASGKGELHISGNITLDNKGMAGKDGEHATLSHADAKVLGDASISHVRVEDSTIDVAEGCTVNFSQVVLAATARLTDEPATAHLDEVTAELMMGVNTSKMADGVLPVGVVLVQNGNTAQTLSPEAEATVVQLEATTFDSLTLTGSSLVLELRGLETELYNGADYIALSFTSGKSYATFEEGLAVLLSTDGEHYAQGHYLQGGDHAALYFAAREAGMAPEPATATLSLLALAALAARRRRHS